MDRLIWDLDSLRTILTGLRRADRQLQECREQVYAAVAAAQEMIGGDTGSPPLQRLAEEIGLLARRTGKAAEYDAALADALAQVRDSMTRTEAELVSLVSELPTGAALPFRAIRPWTAANIAPLYTVPPTRWTYDIVPEWLEQAADQMPAI